MRRSSRFLPGVALALLLALVPLVYGQYRASAQPAGRLLVVTSTTLFGDMIGRVGGDLVEVSSLVPPGADPHTFEPSPRDVARANNARVAVWNGLGLDERVEEEVASLGIPNLVTVTLTSGIEPLEMAEGDEEHGTEADHGHEHGAGNPHMWLDPTLGMRYVGQIRDALGEADPANAATYTANADRYLAELAQLDADAFRQVAAVPVERRKLVVFHDAFPYLARHYGFEVAAVVVRSPGREPSAQEVAELINEIRAHDVPTVYREPQFNARILELAARDAGVRVGTLYSDALDSEVTSYADLLRYNVNSLVEGLR
jgi:manganese/iron transport system substrate-binding protein